MSPILFEGAHGSTTSDQEIAEVERRRYEAMKKADVNVLREVLDDLLVYAHSNSETDDKESYLARVQTGYYRYESISIDEQSAVVLPNLALLRGRMRAQGYFNGSPLTLDNRFLAVLRCLDGQWRLLGYQPTPVK
ncbi:nuclear transport factor 2 family protein [Bradyrhizobium ganzhouense]|uniref:nuclear transport factor 2 family protein n=1 Tax=Bradyrhizobium ganzhouense TaxID=1179767 RepID=UPI003CF8971D